MRRTASEMLNELQVRIARLERQASFDNDYGSLVQVEGLAYPTPDVKEAILKVKRVLENDSLRKRLSPFPDFGLDTIELRVRDERQTGSMIELQATFAFEVGEDDYTGRPQHDVAFADIKVIGDKIKITEARNTRYASSSNSLVLNGRDYTPILEELYWEKDGMTTRREITQILSEIKRDVKAEYGLVPLNFTMDLEFWFDEFEGMSTLRDLHGIVARMNEGLRQL
jgi:hypothetical protein